MNLFSCPQDLPEAECAISLTAAAAAEVGQVDVFVVAARNSDVAVLIGIQGSIDAIAILLLLLLL